MECCGSCSDPCDAVDCADPATCTVECCGSCSDPCDAVDCADPATCTVECCGACDPCDGVVCDDEDACNGEETCDPATGGCLTGTAVDCDDGDLCTTDNCDSDDGSCDNAPTDCDNGDACDGEEVCSPGDGLCQPGTPLDCDDVNLCTDDGCAPATGCWNNPMDCGDGDICTDDDCSPGDGLCTHPATDCGDGDACTVDSCDSVAGCLHAPVDCDDGNPCTDDLCDASGTCQHPPNAAECDDEDPCTINDICSGGSCGGEPKPCDDLIDCTVDGCNPDELDESDEGTCVHSPSDGMCPDESGDPCLVPSCDPTQGCVDVNAPDDTECEDGDLCTLYDTCQGGICEAGAEKDCSDDTDCTDDLCSPGSGECYNPPMPGMCEECKDEPELPDVSASFEAEFPMNVECPVVGGTAGISLSASGSISGSAASCPECKSEFSAKGKLGGTLDLCSGTSFSLDGGGGYSSKTQYCVDCDDDTCEKFCGDDFCATEKFNGFANLGVSRFYGYKNKWKAGGGRILPTISMTIKCGVTVGGKAGVDGSYEYTEDGGCDPCEECEEVTGNVNLGVSGDGGCGASLKVGKFNAKFGCMTCGHLGIDFSGGGSQKWGECADETCIKASVGANAGVNLPCWDIGIWWFKVSVECSASVAGSCKYNSCTGTGCGIDDTSASCSVSKGACN